MYGIRPVMQQSFTAQPTIHSTASRQHAPNYTVAAWPRTPTGWQGRWPEVNGVALPSGKAAEDDEPGTALWLAYPPPTMLVVLN